VQAGGRSRSVLLCNTFEALIGALYLQVGIEYTQNYIGALCEENADIILDHHKNEDPKSKLQEWSQGKGLLTPLYVTKNSVGPDHARQFEVEVFISNNSYGVGSGPSKQTAEKSAAVAALKLLGLYNRIG
jgi:ribonuclease-3